LIAKKIGFKVPHTLVSNNQESVKSFVNTHTTCITKPSQDGTFITGTDFGVSTITKMINNDTFRSFEKAFFTPSLFQKLIDKEYEIRVIFIENQIFSVGIFSQTNEKTKIDYRNYDSDKPNRLQLISLPKSVEKNIRQLMQELKINFGSIDLIKAIDGDYYFLEINPVGQFLGISNILNLKIERIIAQILKNKDELQRI
jgi:glutathione synthase/RimK-type ligase-like ATP-grasp enzyme